MERWKSHWPITMEGRDKKAKVCHERGREGEGEMNQQLVDRSLPKSSLNHLVDKMPPIHASVSVT